MLGLITFLAANAIYVSPKGNDQNAGTERQPVASVAKAVDLARAHHIHRIVLEGGEYRLNAGLTLDDRDSGLTLEAGRNGRPLVTGAAIVPAIAISVSLDTNLQVRAQRLNPNAVAYRIDTTSLPAVKLAPYVPYGFPRPILPGPSELFENETPMTIARWPNAGFATIKSVREPGNGESDRSKPPRQPVFTADSDEPERWKSTDTAWLYGYWKYDWADETIKLHSVDPKTGEITLETPHTYGVAAGSPFFIENLVEELDAVGEYYSDPTSGTIQFVAEKSKKPATYRISVLGDPLLSIKNADNITIRGIDFAYSRGDGADLDNATDTRFEGCQFFNLGERAVVIENGHDSGLAACNIWNTAHGGVVLSGGDRKTLTPARLFVENCDIHDYQRRAMTYRPGVSISGVGNRVSHCAIHDAPHSAIIFGGNDHVIEFNEFYRTISRTGDGGVVYTGRDWTARGTQISDNYFHDNIGLSKWEPAIYFDDLASGLIATHNLIERCHWGFLIGGGRDNVILGNQIVDCKQSFHCDARGLGWAASSKPTMMERLNAVPYRQEPWRTKYPPLVEILTNNPMAPAGNVIRDNDLIRSGRLLADTESPFRTSTLYEGNVESGTGVTMSTAKMGLIKDKIRRSLPTSPSPSH